MSKSFPKIRSSRLCAEINSFSVSDSLHGVRLPVLFRYSASVVDTTLFAEAMVKSYRSLLSQSAEYFSMAILTS